MSALASTPTWIPEDDLLLKNAVESGGSLEALAKGAVRFSRKFTVQELRDRWHSLLYDPVISAEASARMVEFELSAPNSLSKSGRFCSSKESMDVPSKRKGESIRSQYNSMKKRTCSQPLNPIDLGFLGAPNGTDCIGNGGGCEEEHMADRLVDFGNCMEPSSPVLPDMAVWKTTENVGGKTSQVVDETLDDEQIDGVMTGSTAILAGDFEDLSDSLLNIPNEGNVLFMDVDGKDTKYKSGRDATTSLLLSSPNNVDVDDRSSDREPQILLSSKDDYIPEGDDTTVVDDVNELPDSLHDSPLTVCHSEVKMQSSTPEPTPPLQLRDEEMNCALNSEDPEIPSNDDMFLPNEFASSIIRPNPTEHSNPCSSSTFHRNLDQEIRLKKEDNPLHTVSQILGSEKSIITSPHDRLVSHRLNKDFPDGNYFASISRHVYGVSSSPSHSRLEIGTSKSATDGTLKEDVHQLIAVREHKFLHKDTGSSRTALPETETNPPLSDNEESDADDDIPYFSDIETMILEMDLCPNDQDSHLSEEVLSYQHEDAKRNIMRLEQCARSITHRAMASQGAFAILYGRHLKQYIKKTEVILGRSTEDFEVDIDLRKEGQANKISRRQAVIRMENDGTFILKNLGKSPIYLNGKEVATGHLLSLSSNSLIEIREMALVFEMDHKFVRRYLTNITRMSPGMNTNFEWSPEGIHR